MRGKEEFELRAWYASEDAKRKLGSICQAVNERGDSIGLLGSEACPLLLLSDADEVQTCSDEHAISIEEAKANWATITAAALFFGATFRILGKKRPRAVLARHPENRHPATRYRKPKKSNLRPLVTQLERILEELRSMRDSLGQSAELIDRRFRELWRETQGLTNERDASEPVLRPT